MWPIPSTQAAPEDMSAVSTMTMGKKSWMTKQGGSEITFFKKNQLCGGVVLEYIQALGNNWETPNQCSDKWAEKPSSHNAIKNPVMEMKELRGGPGKGSYSLGPPIFKAWYASVCIQMSCWPALFFEPHPDLKSGPAAWLWCISLNKVGFL